METSNRSAPAQEENGADRTRRRKLGRAARRRRKKLLDIQKAEEEIRAKGSLVLLEEQDTVLPLDRGKVWPAVIELRKKFAWNAQDEPALVAQLGYLPGNVILITCRTSLVPELTRHQDENLPVAIQLYPIVLRDEYAGGKTDGRKFKGRKRQKQTIESDLSKVQMLEEDDKSLIEPFPTMYWLTNPLLRILISKLEVANFGIQLEERLSSSPQDLESMERAHAAYGKERYELITKDDWELIRCFGWESAFATTRGVSGIKNPAAVKCLHAHTAHYLSGCTDNVLGRWVMEALAGIFDRKESKDTYTN